MYLAQSEMHVYQKYISKSIRNGVSKWEDISDSVISLGETYVLTAKLYNREFDLFE